MISYEPPKQEAFGAGDYIDGLGTVLDPDDDEMTAFIDEMASGARQSSQATAQDEIKLVRCVFCGEYGQWEMWHIYDPWEMRHMFTPVCYSCRRRYMVDRGKAQEVIDEWKKENECKQLTEGA